MTRVLHTADVHLTPDYPERKNGLRKLLNRAETDDIDVVTIGTAKQEVTETMVDEYDLAHTQFTS